MKIPSIGDKIYIDTALHISRGEDDVHGGIATITKVDVRDSPEPMNTIFVRVAENPNVMYNYKWLMERQEKLEAEFGSQVACPDPDYNDYGDRW